MKELRNQYIEENKTLRQKYIISEEYVDLNEEILQKKAARKRAIEKSIHEYDHIEDTTIGDKIIRAFLDD
jgi:hypothetical protein